MKPMEVPQQVAQLAKLVQGYIVGGAVRDHYLNLPIHDYDIATPLLPQEILQLLSQHKYKSLLTGVKYGTVSVLVDGIANPIEITTYRSEKYSNNRFPDVAFHTNQKNDLMRRDFTINAMAYDVDKHIVIDPYGGLQDIFSRTLRFVGDGAQRIQEDPLRILRACRLAANLHFTIHKDTAENLERYSELLKTISQERIIMEINKAGTYFPDFVSNVIQHKLDPYVFGVDLQPMHNIIHDQRGSHYGESLYQHTINTLLVAQQHGFNDFVTNIALLFHDVGKIHTQNIVDGKTMFLTHDKVSTEIFQSTFGAFSGLPDKQRKEIIFLITHHLRFAYMYSLKTIIHTVVDWRIAGVPWKWIQDLSNVAYADQNLPMLPKKVSFSNLMQQIQLVWTVPRPDGTLFLKFPATQRKELIRAMWIEQTHKLLKMYRNMYYTTQRGTFGQQWMRELVAKHLNDKHL